MVPATYLTSMDAVPGPLVNFPGRMQVASRMKFLTVLSLVLSFAHTVHAEVPADQAERAELLRLEEYRLNGQRRPTK